MLHPDLGIIAFGDWGRDEDQGCLKPGGQMCFVDQLLAYPTALVLNVDGKIRKVAAKGEVSDRPRDADEFSGIASGNDQISPPQRGVEACEILHGPSLAERRSDQDCLEFFRGQGGLDSKVNAHGNLRARWSDLAAIEAAMLAERATGERYASAAMCQLYSENG